MGKRELLLIVAFVIVGAVVYQATAPPSGPNERGFSLSGIVAKVRREMRGNRANAEATRVTTHQIDPATTEIRVSGGLAELTIVGEDRSDVEVRFRVTSTGYDEAEAKDLIGQTILKVDRAGPALRLTPDYPNPGTQRAFLTVAVPARLGVRIDPGPQRATISNVLNLEMTGVRGDSSIKKIAGRATITHRAGRLVIEDVAALKLTGRGSDVTVSRVRGDASFSMQSGELTTLSISGPIDVESQNAEVRLRKLDESQGPLRVNANGGSVTLDGLKGDARIDGRNTEIEIAMSKPGAVAVYNDGEQPLRLTTPPGGFTLDARVTHGELSLPDELRGQLKIGGESGTGEDKDKEHLASGAVRGGGPTITLRANRGDLTIRSRDAAKPEPPKSDR